MNINTSVRLPKDHLEQLKEIAKGKDRSVSYLISSIIKDYLNKRSE